jgi:PAS domain S-box-containing protein
MSKSNQVESMLSESENLESAQVLQELASLRSQVKQLESDNLDLQIALETTTEHGDAIEKQLYITNQELEAQIQERQLAHATLESILEMVTKDKRDLEIVVDTIKEHGDTVEYQLYSDAVDFMRRSEEQFRAIAEATPIIMMIGHLSDGLITYANSTCNETLGIDAKNMQGKKLQEFYYDSEDNRNISEILAAHGSVKNYEMRVRKVDKSLIWVAASLHPLSLSGKSIYLSTFYDITARKQAEMALQLSEQLLRQQAEELESLVEQRTKALQSAESELRALFEAMTDTILVYDRQGICLKVAPTNSGLTLSSLTNKSVYDIFPLKLANLHAQLIRQALEQQQSLTVEYQSEDRNPLPDRDLWRSATISPLSQNSVIWVERDISDRKKAEADLKAAKEAAEIANLAKSQFLANMSHELRTPLNAILGFSQLMMGDASITSVQQENLGIIESSGEHLLALINDVLEMSKIESGNIVLNEFNFDLHRLLDRLKDMLSLKAESKGISLIFIQSNEIPRYVLGDEVKLSQVLINLLSNALKFTQQGGVTLTVENLSPTCPQSLNQLANRSIRLLFKVADSGVGIAEVEIPTIFDAFVQSQSGRKSQEGTGLGLTISRKFVNLMGGDITAISTPGEGSVFSFDAELKFGTTILADSLDGNLLRDGDRFSKRQIKDRVISQTEDPEASFKLRILLAEDNVVNQKVALRMLGKLGFSADVVIDGEEVLDALDHQSYDLILMDVQMPKLDGVETTQFIYERFAQGGRFKKQDRMPIVIALTAHAMQEERDRCLAAGMDEHLSKPVRLEELQRILEHCVSLVRK